MIKQMTNNPKDNKINSTVDPKRAQNDANNRNQPDTSKQTKKDEKSKGPRFSRLFGGGSSKKSSDGEKRCKSGRHKHKEHQRLSKESKFKFPAHKSCEVLSDTTKTSKSSKASKIESKNVKGTLSSEHCSEGNSKHRRSTRNLFRGLRKSGSKANSLTKSEGKFY